MSGSEDAAPRTETSDVDGDDDREADPAGLEGLPDGSGCVEIWDYLSERRRGD